MIPHANLDAWQLNAPWQTNEQIEQDLIITRILTEIFQSKMLQDRLLFRGGTALHKLYFPKPLRYSEDLDFVQLQSESAGPIADEIRTLLLPWLGRPQTDAGPDSFKMLYHYTPESQPDSTSRIKLEWNTREHFAVYGVKKIPFKIQSNWFQGDCEVRTYELDELAGTKLRALYQRKKGRDLFDIAELMKRGLIDPQRTVNAYKTYLDFKGTTISKKEYQLNLEEKLQDSIFLFDMDILKLADLEYDPLEAVNFLEPLINLM